MSKLLTNMSLLFLLLMYACFRTSARQTIAERQGSEVASDSSTVRSFIISNDTFIKDGTAFYIHSGDMHYARVPHAYWRDRLERLRALGLNAVTTYVPWNWHEFEEGHFDFESARDIEGFIRIAHDVGLLVLLRPGPYICAEWDFGGFPAWLLTKKDVALRTHETNFMRYVRRWWEELLPRMRPLLYSNGGPIIMVQIENEYGYFGRADKVSQDREYMMSLVEMAHEFLGGPRAVVLYTTDNGKHKFMERGSLKGDVVVSLGDGGWDACAGDQKHMNPDGLNPCMNTEDYTGWITHWGDVGPGGANNAVVTSQGIYRVKEALKAGYSFSLYMAHGGTSFGWTSGANVEDETGCKGFQPQLTTYDYNAPVSEIGDHGKGDRGLDTFLTLQATLQEHAETEGPLIGEPAPLPRKTYGDVLLADVADFLEVESLRVFDSAGPRKLKTLVGMEEFGQSNGFIYYTATITTPGSVLEIGQYPRDRAQVFVDGTYNGAIYRPESAPLQLRSPVKIGSHLGILVENMGRVNFGKCIGGNWDAKGIVTNVTLDGVLVQSWQAWSLQLDYSQVSSLNFKPMDSRVLHGTDATHGDAAFGCNHGPAFYRGMLQVRGRPEDTYLQPHGFTKGVVWVNGHNLGRYWEAQGPQRSYFLPAPFLREGANVVVLLELEPGNRSCSITFVRELVYRATKAVKEVERLKQQKESAKFKASLLDKLKKLATARLRKTQIAQWERYKTKIVDNAENGRLKLASLPLLLGIIGFMFFAALVAISATRSMRERIDRRLNRCDVSFVLREECDIQQISLE